MPCELQTGYSSTGNPGITGDKMYLMYYTDEQGKRVYTLEVRPAKFFTLI